MSIPMPKHIKLGSIWDDTRVISCSACGHKSRLSELMLFEGHCPSPSCGADLCVFCGCSEAAACLGEPMGRNCSWQQPAVCDFCFNELIECTYYDAAGEPEKVPFFKERRRPLTINEGSQEIFQNARDRDHLRDGRSGSRDHVSGRLG